MSRLAVVQAQSDTTDWCAMSPRELLNAYGMARMDSGYDEMFGRTRYGKMVIWGRDERDREINVDQVVYDVITNADEHAHKKPNMRTLWEEVSEATLSWRGKHEHPLRLELIQIAGICINMIRQIDADEDFKS